MKLNELSDALLAEATEIIGEKFGGEFPGLDVIVHHGHVVDVVDRNEDEEC